MPITLKKIHEIANEVVKHEFDSLSENEVREALIDLTQKKKRDVLLDAVGLEISWGSDIRLKHDGILDRTTKKLIEDIIKPNTQKFLEGVYADQEIVLTEREIAHLRKVYRDKYIRAMEEELYQLATTKAQSNVDALFDEYLKGLE